LRPITAAQGHYIGRAAHHLIGPQASNPPVLSPRFEVVVETAEVVEYLYPKMDVSWMVN